MLVSALGGKLTPSRFGSEKDRLSYLTGKLGHVEDEEERGDWDAVEFGPRDFAIFDITVSRALLRKLLACLFSAMTRLCPRPLVCAISLLGSGQHDQRTETAHRPFLKRDFSAMGAGYCASQG